MNILCSQSIRVSLFRGAAPSAPFLTTSELTWCDTESAPDLISREAKSQVGRPAIVATPAIREAYPETLMIGSTCDLLTAIIYSVAFTRAIVGVRGRESLGSPLRPSGRRLIINLIPCVVFAKRRRSKVRPCRQATIPISYMDCTCTFLEVSSTFKARIHEEIDRSVGLQSRREFSAGRVEGSTPEQVGRN